METSAFWNIQLPTNLTTLISNSQLHKQKLARYWNLENKITLFTQKLEYFFVFFKKGFL